MRLPRFRLRVRTLLALVAMTALALAGQRIYRDGLETHWLLLRLRYGNAAARRSAMQEAKDSESRAMFRDLWASALGGPVNQGVVEQQWRGQQRRAELLLPALFQHAAKDSDEGCRADALNALSYVAALHASEIEKRHALHSILVATRDRSASVRAAAIGSLPGLAARDTAVVLTAFRSALIDPSVEVRQAAADGLGWLGVMQPTTQSEVAPILRRLLAGRDDRRVRNQAAWSMCYLFVDRKLHPLGLGPDVVASLLAALRDPEPEVRRTVARILGSTASDNRGRLLPRWGQRKDEIIPALESAISDDVDFVREEVALALFHWGRRDQAVIDLIEQATRDSRRPQKTKNPFDSALRWWRSEQEAKTPVEPPAQAEPSPCR